MKGNRENSAGNGAPKGPGRIGVIDIGSNTVRLVVYEVPTRLPFPLFNEKAQCGLGRALSETGRLDPAAVDSALKALARFVLLAEAMGVDRLELVATAAVREASDGPDFVAEVERRLGVKVDVIDGAEEAQLAARGVLSGVPDADGLLGDLGGGSLDLVVLDRGKFGRCATYPLGHLRLLQGAGSRDRAAVLVGSSLAEETWLEDMTGRNLYALGGSWRTVARVLLYQVDWPLHVIDNFALPAADALDLLAVMARMSNRSIRQIPLVSRRRMEALPFAALVLEMLIERMHPKTLIFSGFGMREGRMLACLPPEVRGPGPADFRLLQPCRARRPIQRPRRGDPDLDDAFVRGRGCGCGAAAAGRLPAQRHRLERPSRLPCRKCVSTRHAAAVRRAYPWRPGRPGACHLRALRQRPRGRDRRSRASPFVGRRFRSGGGRRPRPASGPYA